VEYIIVQLATAFIGSLGFAIILKIKGKQIVYAGIGGVLSWGVYLWAYAQLEGYFAANFTAALFAAVYAEIMARVNRAPATIFLTAAAIPLIPGRNLYNTMYGIVSEDSAFAWENATTAIVISLAISFGFVFVAVVNKYLNRLKAFRKGQ
jgi:uncharacterized membrane protein YjjB (DUF3815 family)